MDKIKIILKNPKERINISFKKKQNITLNFKDKIILGGKYAEYEGEYEITPRTETQTLPTKQKNMKNDIQVKAIPYFETSNIQNGKTVYIG